MRCTSISADSIVSGLITRFISLQHALLNDERFLPAEKQRGFWSMNGRTPASVTAGRSAECHNAGSSPFLLFGRIGAKALPRFVQAWKQWTSKRIGGELKFPAPIWQKEFFDHVLRSSKSYSQKWEYVRENPVRAGLVAPADQWAWQGQIEELRL